MSRWLQFVLCLREIPDGPENGYDSNNSTNDRFGTESRTWAWSTDPAARDTVAVNTICAKISCVKLRAHSDEIFLGREGVVNVATMDKKLLYLIIVWDIYRQVSVPPGQARKFDELRCHLQYPGKGPQKFDPKHCASAAHFSQVWVPLTSSIQYSLLGHS